MKYIVLALALTFSGCAIGPNSAELETFCEEQDLTFECRIAGAYKANSAFVNQVANSVEAGTIDREDALKALDLSERAEELTNIARTSGDISDLQNAEAILIAIEQILIAGLNDEE